MADDFRLLMDFFDHEVAVVALINEQRTRHRFDHRAFDTLSCAIENLSACPVHNRAIALFEIGDGIGERSERDGVGSQIHFAGTVTNGER